MTRSVEQDRGDDTHLCVFIDDGATRRACCCASRGTRALAKGPEEIGKLCETSRGRSWAKDFGECHFLLRRQRKATTTAALRTRAQREFVGVDDAMASWRRNTRVATFLCGVWCLVVTARPVEATCDVDALFANADAMTNATVDALRAWLHGVASAHHSPVTYAAAYDLLESIDSRDAQTVRLAYGGSAPKCRAFERDACVWNREHLWPQSYGVGESSGLPYDAPPRVDMHALVPSHAALNSARETGCSRIWTRTTRCARVVDGVVGRADVRTPVATERRGRRRRLAPTGFWQPPSNMKGFVARAMLYMALRYDGDDDDTYDLRLAQEAYRVSQEAYAPSPNQTRPDAHYAFGRLSDLLRWHASSAVAEWERARNDAVCAAQGNRNRSWTARSRPRVFGTVAEAEAGNWGTWTTRTGENPARTRARRAASRSPSPTVAGVLLSRVLAAFY